MLREYLDAGLKADNFWCIQLRFLFEAMVELAKQGTPRSWFSAFALVREIPYLTHAFWRKENGDDAWPRARRDVYLWHALARGVARRCP
jgi:hypothetical protein